MTVRSQSVRKRRGPIPENPWIPAADDQPTPEVHAPATARAPATSLRAVPAAGISLPTTRFAVRPADERTGVWWVGAHGGAGESTMEQLLDGSRAAGHAWPLTGNDQPAPGGSDARVIVVARTSATGLRAAQALLVEWASGEVNVDLLGLVLIADAPGRLPRVLREFSDLVAGGAPRAWRVPWVEAWRTGEPVCAQTAPRAVRRLLDDVAGSDPEDRDKD